MADDLWQSRSHGEIVRLLGELNSDAAHEESQRWNNTSQAVSDSIDTALATRQKLLDDSIWGGQAAEAAYTRVDTFYKKAADPVIGLAAEAGKISQAALQDGETLISASRVAQNYPELGSGAPTERKNEELEAIRAEAQRMYTSQLAVTRPEITDESGQQPLGPLPVGTANENGGSNTGTGSGGEKLQSSSPSDSLANRDTKPQLASGDSQQAGAGQGQGGGSGSGGGGAPSGGTGSGSGDRPGSGFSSGLKDSSIGQHVGGTTAAGYSPSPTGAGSGGSVAGGPGGGLGGLRGGTAIPGGTTSGTGGAGFNPAAVGSSGVRGAGPMGMMGAGAHGARGKGADDEDGKPTPPILMNVDNGNELFGELPKASPRTIGDWSEQEEMAKRNQEAEVRRYKSMGWDLKWE
jgi:hypothetical protein